MSKHKMVALVTQYYPPETGAAANRMRFFTDILLQHFERVEVFTAHPNYPDPAFFLNSDTGRRRWWSRENHDSLTIFRSRIYPANRGGVIRRALNFISMPIMLIRWTREICKHDVFVVTSGPMFVGLPILMLSHFKKIDILLDVRDLWPERLWETGASNPPGLVRWLLKYFEKWMYARSSVLLTVTNALEKRLSIRIGQKKPIYLVRNTDQQYNRPVSVSSDLEPNLCLPGKPQDDTLVVIEAGTQGYAQDPESLCEAVLSLEDRYPGKLQLYIAGSGSKVDAVQQYAERSDCIFYLGNLNLELLGDLLQQGDLGVACLMDTEHNQMAVSRRLFDYASYKLALVLSGSGEGSEILNSTGAGLVVRPENFQALADAIEQFLLNPGLLRHYKLQSRALLSGEYGTQHSAEELNRAIAVVLQTRIESRRSKG